MSNSLSPLGDIHQRIENEEKFSEDVKQQFKDFVSDNYYDIDYGPESVTLSSFTADDFNNISKLGVEFDDKNSIIYGKNSLGKTSLLRAIQYNLMGLPEDKQKYGMTDLIQSGKDRAFTEGNWKIDNTQTLIKRELYREGRGGKLHGYDEPTVVDEPAHNGVPEDSHNQPETVYRKTGILPLCNRDYDAYEFMSLFFLMSRDFLNFINWKGKSTEVIDILFGINLTNVSNAVDNRRKRADEIPDAIDNAPVKGEEYQEELQAKNELLEDLKREKASLETQISDKRGNLESIRQNEDAEERLNRLRSRRSSLESKRADLKSQRAELVSDLAEVRRLIERYEDRELTEDLDGLADELRDLLSVPDRCPVCMNDVDSNQRERLRDEHQCPLCSKEMPEDRIRKEKEYQAPDSLADRQEAQQDELQELQEEENDIEYEIETIEEQIASTEDDIEEVEQRLEESGLEQEVERREELESEIRELRREAVSVEVEIESLEERIEELEWEVKAHEHLREIREARKDQKSNLKRLSGLVDTERNNQRRKLQRQLSDRMKTIIDVLSDGFFADATAVSFDSRENYHFTIHTPGRKYQSSKADKESAEATLLSLIFHAAVLKHLVASGVGSIPIRFFVIDSPYSNDMDPGNRRDVTTLISQLPEYLEEYQTIITMAKPEGDRMRRLEDSSHTLIDIRNA